MNNAVYSTYLEQARIGILGGLEEFILARVEIDFREQLHHGGEVLVRSRCSRIGTKSFDLEHAVVSDGVVVAEAKSVLVAFDYATGQSILVTDALRRALSDPAARRQHVELRGLPGC